nr:histone deacetylase 14 [Tanacetum cinerariifolium]
SKHKFHPRPDSPLHLPNEEPFLGYLKFSAKGTKREFFGMPIPGKLITADIQGEPYYKEYLEKVAKHQRYLVGEKGSDPDSPALKLTKATKKSKASAPKADLRPPVIKPASSQPPEPKPTPAKSYEKKHKSVDEGIPENEPRFDYEEADVQRTLEESLMSVYDAPQGPLPPMVIREPKSGKYQPLPEVESDKDVAGIDVEVQDEGQAGPNPGEQDEGQARLNPGDAAASQPQSSPVVHARPNLEHMDLEATDENLKLTVKVQVILEEPASSTGTLSSLQHLAKDLSFGDLFFNDKPSEADNEKTTTETEAESMVSVIIQQDTSGIPPMTTPIIDLTSRPDSPNVHRPLQATETETTMTTTTTTHPPPPQPQQSTTDSMLMKRIGELEQIMANLIQDNRHLEERDLPEADMKEILHQRMWETNSYKSHKDHMMLYEALEKSMNHDHTDELLKDLAEARKKKKRDVIHQKCHMGLHLINHLLLHHQQVHLELQDLLEFLDHHKCRHHLLHLLHLHPPTRKPLEEDRSATLEPAWSILSSGLPVPKNHWASALASTYSPPPEDSLLAQTGDIAIAVRTHMRILSVVRIEVFSMYGYSYMKKIVLHIPQQVSKAVDEIVTDAVEWAIQAPPTPPPPPAGPSGTSGSPGASGLSQVPPLPPPPPSTNQEDLHIDDDMAPDAQAHSSDNEDIRNAHIPKASALASTYSPLPEDSLLAQTGDMAMFMDWFCKRQEITKLKPQDLEGPASELVKVFHPNMWIEEECKYDIASMYGISHWWSQRIEVFSMYGYDYMKKIVLHRADLNEHNIAEQDFKYL